jgi:peptidoglycan/xylan/chitin deacetylase (PgdA/CDA1 family)
MMGSLLRLGRRLVLPGGAKSRLAILTYHRVLPKPDPIQVDEVDVASFDWQMGVLSKNYNVLPLDVALDRLYRNELEPGSVSVTFDDGYLDNLTNAAPILKKWNITATLFIATAYLDGGVMWNDMIIEGLRNYPGDELDLASLSLGSYDFSNMEKRRRSIYALLEKVKYHEVDARVQMARTIVEIAGQALPESLMLSSEQVASLGEHNFIVGGHTHTHPILGELELAEAEQEIRQGKQRLETLTGRPLRLFAYPNGRPGKDYHREHADLVARLGFDYAVTTAWGTAGADSSRLQLPRISPWDRRPAMFDLRVSKSLMSTEYETV